MAHETETLCGMSYGLLYQRLRRLCSKRSVALVIVGALVLCYAGVGDPHHSLSETSAGTEAHASASITACEANDGASHEPLGEGLLSALSTLLAGLLLAALACALLVWRLAPEIRPKTPPTPLSCASPLDRGRRMACLQVFLL